MSNSGKLSVRQKFEADQRASYGERMTSDDIASLKLDLCEKFMQDALAEDYAAPEASDITRSAEALDTGS